MNTLQIFQETGWGQLTILVDYIQNLSALKLNITNKGKITFNIASPIGSEFDWKNPPRIDLDFLEVSKLILILDKLINLILSNKITSTNKIIAVSSLLNKIFRSNKQDGNKRNFTNIFHLYSGNISNLNFTKPTDINEQNIGTLFSFQIYKKRNNISSTSNFYPINIDRAILLSETLKHFQKDMLILNHFGNINKVNNKDQKNNIINTNINKNANFKIDDEELI